MAKCQEIAGLTISGKPEREINGRLCSKKEHVEPQEKFSRVKFWKSHVLIPERSFGFLLTALSP